MKWWIEILYKLGLKRAALQTKINVLQAELDEERERTIRGIVRRAIDEERK
jgi:hypothetical protein